MRNDIYNNVSSKKKKSAFEERRVMNKKGRHEQEIRRDNFGSSTWPTTAGVEQNLIVLDQGVIHDS